MGEVFAGRIRSFIADWICDVVTGPIRVRSYRPDARSASSLAPEAGRTSDLPVVQRTEGLKCVI